MHACSQAAHALAAEQSAALDRIRSQAQEQEAGCGGREQVGQGLHPTRLLA